jgi:putative oxidoreductase
MKKTIGRVVFGIIFCIFGSFHFIKGSQMAGAVPAWIPGGVIWVYVTGLILLLAGISILINKKASLLSPDPGSVAPLFCFNGASAAGFKW